MRLSELRPDYAIRLLVQEVVMWALVVAIVLEACR